MHRYMLSSRVSLGKIGYTKKGMHWCLGHYEDLNALGPGALVHLNPHSALNTSAFNQLIIMNVK